MGEMKRLWAAVGILAALLAAALGTGWWVDGLTADYVSRLEQAQAMSERGDWERAAQVTGGVYRNWQERSFWLHALLRHSDTDQVLLLFRSTQPPTPSSSPSWSCWRRWRTPLWKMCCKRGPARTWHPCPGRSLCMT